MSEGEASKPRRKPVITGEMLVGVSAVVIGVCALFVSLYEAQLMRAEQRSSVLPILQLSRSFYLDAGDDETVQEWRVSMSADNVGIGPARVLDFRVTVDGNPQPNWASAMNELLGAGLAVPFGTSTINGRTVPADGRVTMFDLTDDSLARAIAAGMSEGRLDFEACYCSVFNECWVVSYQSNTTESQPIEACVGDASSFEQ